MLLTQLFCVFTGDIAGVCNNICIMHNIVCICVSECILKVRVCVGGWVGGCDNVCDCLCKSLLRTQWKSIRYVFMLTIQFIIKKYERCALYAH